MKIIKISAVIIAGILLTGCRNTELGNRAIVQAAAVDYSQGEYTVSALLFSSGGGSGGEIDPSNENVIKITGTGETFSQAIEDISLTDGKKLFFSENRLLVLGNGFMDADVAPMLKTLTEELRCSPDMLVCCCDDPELLTDLKFTEGLTAAEKPSDMIKNAYESGSAPKAVLLDMINNTASGKDMLLPMFSPEENGYGTTADESGLSAVISGSRRLSGGRLSERLDNNRTKRELILSGETDKTTLSFSHGGLEHTVSAYGIKAARSEGKTIISARFKGINGKKLPEEIKTAALNELKKMLEA